jgi:DNA-binding SARP family transcriptional activator/tetratricopeptide (TPR) repeat protein
MPPAGFVLKCLGYPELRGPDGKVVRIRVKKHLALLVYLAVERRRFLERGRLVGLLWPGVSAEKGRHSIATAISLLRTIFGRGAFPTNRTAIRFTPANLQLDLDRLDAGRVLGAEGEADLDIDAFLAGFEIPDAPEFGFWKEREHARRLPAIHAGLLTLIDHGRRRGSHDEIMRQAERLLAIDHLAEEGVRAKMEALALVGDRFAAIRVFEDWKGQLASELGAEPSGHVEGMASQLRKRGWEPKEPNPVPAVPAEQWRDRRFVGRKAEYRRLYETWEAVRQYRPQHFMIVGDSGIGKTTLVQRLVTAAGLEGASVSRVQCYQMEQRIPFGMIGALVAGLLGRPGVAATSPEALAEVGRIVPQVKEHFPVLPAPKLSEGESARLLFAEGVMDLLRAVMEERPLLLVVDDLHHADEASMAVLHLVMRRIEEGRFMVALASSLGEWQHTPHHWQPFLARPGVVQLNLNPMPPQETRTLIENCLDDGGPPPSLPILRALCKASNGSPLFAEFVAADWRKYGSRSIALAFRSIVIPKDHTDTHSEPYCSLVIDRALDAISPRSTKVLALASFLGPRLDNPSWYSLIGLSLGEALEAINELVQNRVLRDSGDRLEFPNDIIRAHIYRRIPPAFRRELHSTIAARLPAEMTPGINLGLELAWHLARAGQETQAVPHLIVGAAEARRLGAPDEAILALESAVPCMTDEEADECRLLISTHYQELGRWQDSLDAVTRLNGASETMLRNRRVLETWALWNLGRVGALSVEHVVEELLNTAVRDFGTAFDTILIAARIACSHRSHTTMQRVLEVACDLERKAPTRDGVPLFVALGTLSFHLGRRAESRRYAEMGAAALAKERADSVAARLRIGIGALHAVAGDYRRADEDFRAALAIADRLENAGLIGQALSNHSVTSLRLRRYDDCVTVAERAIDCLSSQPVDSYCIRSFEAGALAHALLGRSANALDWIKRGDRLSAEAEATTIKQDWQTTKADVLWILGRRRQALECATQGLRLAKTGTIDLHSIGQLARWAARVAIANGFTDNALDWIKGVPGYDQLDVMDEVELAAAECDLEADRYGFVSIESERHLKLLCGQLSNEVVFHLGDLGVLPRF